jgi:AcrR family transcriptional regulator
MATAPRRTRLEHDERRALILAAARRLFSERAPGSVSTTEIAREAGVARGLLHHYFGTKRDLYVEVVRSMLRYPAMPAPEGDAPTVVADAIDRWLTMVERNREAWLAVRGAQGLGHDPEVEQLLEAAREEAVDRLAGVLGVGDGPEARAVLRAYGGLAEFASVEWIVRGRLTRPQIRRLLLESLTALVRDVLPEVERTRPEPTP